MHKYIKYLVLAAVYGLPLSATGQANITANRLIVKDSLVLNGQWISLVNNDPTLSHTGNKSLSTDAAIKAYLQQVLALRKVGSTNRKDSVLSIDPSNRSLVMVPAAGGNGSGNSDEDLVGKVIANRNILQISLYNNPGIDSIRLTATSSDGIVTPILMLKDGDNYGYAYGMPPFSLQGNIPSDSLNNFLRVGVWALSTYDFEKCMSYESNQYAFRGDSVVLDAHMLRGNIALYLNYHDSTLSSYDGYMIRDAHVVNRAKDKSLQVSDASLPQGAQVTSSTFTPEMDYIQINVVDMKYKGNGDYSLGTPPLVNLRLRIYKNGVLFRDKTLTPASGFSDGFEVDTSWNSYEIYLDDIP
jgi:hypothetical protein